MLIALRELVGLLLHETNDLETKLLTLVTFAMVLACECNETFGKTNESDTERTLIDNRLNAVVWLEVLSAIPQATHHERELLGKGCLLELITLVELLCHKFAHLVQTEHEDLDTLFERRFRHSLDSESHDIDGCKREVSTTNGSLWAKAILEDTCATSHCSYLVVVTFRIIWSPLFMMIERSIEIEEVREETTCRYLTSQLIEVVVRVTWQVVDTTLLFPDLDWEDSCSMVAHTLVSRMQEFTHHTTSFSRCVGTIVDRREYHLISTTRMDGIHVMDECLHSLMHSSYGTVHSLLTHAVDASLVAKRFNQIVLDLLCVEFRILLSFILLKATELLQIGHVDVWCEIEVESRNCLSTMHLILSSLERNTRLNTGSFYTLSRTALGMSSLQTMLKDGIKRVLYACKRLGWIVVLVMNMYISAFHSSLNLFIKQIVINEWLGAFAGKLHHHSGRSVGIHIGILARDIIILRANDTLKNLASLGLTRYASCIAV